MDLHMVLSRFGFIHDPDWSFDEWYESMKFQQKEPMSLSDVCVPTSQEDNYFGAMFGGDAVLRVSIDCRADIKQITKKLKELIEIHKNGPSKSLFDLHNKLHLLPSNNSRIREDELKRYLKIYDLKEIEGLTMGEIVNLMDTSSKSEIDSVMRVFWADLAKAKKIISNTEHNEFPGNYQSNCQVIPLNREETK